MTKLIRGKFVKASSLSAPDGPSEERPESQASLLDDRETFASEAAPWVGAENRWRNGIVPPPHKGVSAYLAAADSSGTEGARGLALTMDELETVLSSLPPAPVGRWEGIRRSVSMRLLVYAAVAGVTTIFTWGIVSGVDVPREPTQRGGAEESVGEEIKTYAAAPLSTGEAPQMCAPAVSSAFTASSEEETCGWSEASRAPQEGLDAVSMEEDEAGPAVAVAAEHPTTSRRAARMKKADAAVSERVSVFSLVKAERSSETAGTVAENGAIAPLSVENPYLSSENAVTAPQEVAAAALGSMGAALDMAKQSEPIKPAADEVSISTAEGGLSQADIRRTLSSIAPQVRKCRIATSGQVVVKLEVAGNTGRVIDATPVEQTKVGFSEASCAARVSKLAKFPQFEKSRVTVIYAFDI